MRNLKVSLVRRFAFLLRTLVGGLWSVEWELLSGLTLSSVADVNFVVLYSLRQIPYHHEGFQDAEVSASRYPSRPSR